MYNVSTPFTTLIHLQASYCKSQNFSSLHPQARPLIFNNDNVIMLLFLDILRMKPYGAVDCAYLDLYYGMLRFIEL